MALLAALLPQMILAAEPATQEKGANQTAHDNGVPAARGTTPDKTEQKPAATNAISVIEPRREGGRLDLGLCDGS